MNILFCGDKNIQDGILLSVLSICKNTKRKLNIYIFTASIHGHAAIPKSFAEELLHIVDEKSPGSEVFLIDITEIFGSYLPTANMDTRFTPFCMLRLFADMVPNMPDKILYLDTDVMCLKNFDVFYDSDVSKIEIAGVPDRYGKWFFGNIFRHNYLNSGVLLMNLRLIRENRLFLKCRERCRDKKMFMPDQSALNKLALKKKIPAKYNAQGRVKKNTVFKHFTTFFKFFPYIRTVTIKPWQIEKVQKELKINQFDDIFEEYQRSKKK